MQSELASCSGNVIRGWGDMKHTSTVMQDAVGNVRQCVCVCMCVCVWVCVCVCVCAVCAW